MLTKVDELETIVAPVRIQSQYLELKPIIQAKFDLLKQEIVKLADAEKVSPENKELLLSKPILAEILNGTTLNPLKLASLTFDDGPNEEYTGQVLDILNQYHIKGTFFVMGTYVDQHPKMAKRIVDEGHIIGNHSYSHPNFDKETDETIKKQFNWTQESIKDATGVTPTSYRLPFGAGGLRAVKLLEPLTSIIWNIDSEDWASQDAQKIYEKIMGSLSNNSLILMHDTHQATPDALKKIIPAMLEQGYIFVSPDKVGFDLRYYDNKVQ